MYIRERNIRANKVSFNNLNASNVFARFDTIKYKKNTQNIPKPQPQNNNIEKMLLCGLVLLGTASLAYIAKIKLRKQLFPRDIEYKKTLLTSLSKYMDINPKKTSLLNSIMGKEELTSILKKFNGEESIFSQGLQQQKWVQDTNTMENIEKLKYKANLHIHTTHSDGKMSVQQLLDDAVEYANNVAKKNPKEYFTIAICDHDMTNGCKEALEILVKNSKKYKNLKVVLGCELSSFHEKSKYINQQHRTHLLVYNINPFEGTFANLLQNKQQQTLQISQDIIDKMNEKMHKHWDFEEIEYNLDEAKTSSWCIKDGLNSTISPLKDYFQFRKVYHELVLHNKDLKEFLSTKNLKIDDLPFENTCKNVTYIHKKLTEKENIPYWGKYIISLKWELLKKIHGDDFELSAQNYKQILKEVDKYFDNSSKSLKNSMQLVENEFYLMNLSDEPQLFDFSKTLEILAKDKEISMGIAHPAMSLPYHYKNSNLMEERQKFIAELFKEFKEKGKDNALFYEKVYPYFNNNSYCEINDEFLEFINKEARKHSIIPSGSLDNHGKNLFLTE